MPQNSPPQRQVNPVRPTFFLQDRHLFFFFLLSLSPLSSAPVSLSATGQGTVGTVVPAVSRLLIVLSLAAAAAEESGWMGGGATAVGKVVVVVLLLPSSIDKLAILPGVGARVAGMLVGGACFFLTCSL